VARHPPEFGQRLPHADADHQGPGAKDEDGEDSYRYGDHLWLTIHRSHNQRTAGSAGPAGLRSISQVITVDREFLTEKVSRIRGQLLKNLDTGLRLVLAL